MLKKSG